MKLYTLQRKQWVRQPLDTIYEFFERPENLSLITPPGLDFNVITPVPVKMEQGRIIDYTIRFVGIPIRWRSLISSYHPGKFFVDEQLKGPYSFWHHTHRFERYNGGTLLYDEVRYALPLYLPWPISNLLHALMVRPTLEKIFDYRREQFDLRFNTDEIDENPVVNLFKQVTR